MITLLFINPVSGERGIGIVYLNQCKYKAGSLVHMLYFLEVA